MLPTCPRCGYDLAGQIATWETLGVCPLRGTCPECGQSLGWREVLRQAGLIQGFVEDAYGVRRRLTWAIRTSLWTIWPWRFWSRVGERRRVSPVAWVCWVLVMIWLPRMVAGVGGSAASIALQRLSEARGARVMPPWSIDWTGDFLGNHFGIDYICQGHVLFGLAPMWPDSFRCLFMAQVLWAAAMVGVLPRPDGPGLGRVMRGVVFSFAPFALLGVPTLALSGGGAIYRLMQIYSTKGVGNSSNWEYTLYEAVARAENAIAWLGVVWVALWWLAAMTRGFGLERASRIWMIQLLCTSTVLAILFGRRVVGMWQ
ncbi:MAG: hypothetical protein WC718_02240 [Phycisphaerales bacterium]|jgi:hypothetical protein